MPALLPDKLIGYVECESEDALFNALVRKPDDLVEFFDYACDDETWSRNFSEFIRKVLNWMTTQSFQDKLASDYLEKFAKSIRSHFDNLRTFLPNNLIIRLEDTSIQINSALYSAATPFFHDLIRRECFDKKIFKLEFRDISYAQVFRYVEEFVCTGYVTTLWRMEPEELMPVLRYAANIQLHGLSGLCEDVLAKYLTTQNVYSMLLMSHKESLDKLKQAAFDFINAESAGLRLEVRGANSIACRFFNFSEKTMDIFAKIRLEVTHLIFTDEVVTDPQFSQVVTQCPRLIAVDASYTTYYSEYMPALPGSLQELDLSACEWLSAHHLKKIIDICPNLQKLTLASNVQLTIGAWGELMRLRHLSILDLARCQQIKDEDFRVVLHACAGVTELSLEDCRLMSEKSFYDLGRACSKLQKLNLSRTAVTDAALVDIVSRCRGLTDLNLTRCDHLTDRGIVETIKHGLNLQRLDIANCPVNKATITEALKLRPSLHATLQ